MINEDKNNKPISTPLLDQINNPNDLKFLKLEDLDNLSSELRSDMIDIVSKCTHGVGLYVHLQPLYSMFFHFGKSS